MEILLFLAVVIIFIMVLTIRNNQAAAKELLAKEFRSLKKQLADIQQQIELNGIHGAEIVRQQKEQQQAEALKQHLARIAEIEERKQLHTKPTAILARQPAIAAEMPTPEMATATTGESNLPKNNWLQSWLNNNPDLEKFIGENLFNKIGIAILVLGIGFFVKYAIDQDWINEYGRVAIGICCGAALVGIAHYLRKSYRSFSSVLAGGGLAVLYFTIAFAFHQYHIISQTAAFIIMVIITIFAVLLAILYDKIELAVIASVGGFITPFLLSTGEGNYVVLFSYLSVLNVGLLALSYFKRWRLLNILAFFFTVIIFGSWLVKTFIFATATPPYEGALVFASLFYLLFVAMNMIYNITRHEKFAGFDFLILLLANCLYFAAGLVILHDYHNGNFTGLFTLVLAALNFILAWYFFKANKGEKNLLYLLIGLTLTFISLAAPIQLEGKSITLFWSAETVLLIWLFRRSQIVLFRTASALLTVVMIVSLIIDWQQAAENSTLLLPVIYTGLKGLVTNIVAVIALALAGILLLQEQPTTPWFAGISARKWRMFYFISAGIIFYLTLFYGINLFFAHNSTIMIPNIYQRTLTYLTGLALLVLSRRLETSRSIAIIRFVVLCCCFCFYAASYDYNVSFRDSYIAGHGNVLHLLMNWFSDIILLILFYYSIMLVRKDAGYIPELLRLFSWLICGMLVLFFSVEVSHLYLELFAQPGNEYAYQQQYNKAGVSIIWGICSFAMMWLGMKYHYKTIRIISISLFAATLLKLFSYDITQISAGGKIGAFISLGILLLIISFMYQRLKKILIDDGKK